MVQCKVDQFEDFDRVNFDKELEDFDIIVEDFDKEKEAYMCLIYEKYYSVVEDMDFVVEDMDFVEEDMDLVNNPLEGVKVEDSFLGVEEEYMY
jgi:hypothetical protein